MATRKMTFTLPADLAAQFVRAVPPRSRSRYMAEALSRKLSERDRRLIRSCQVANQSSEVKKIEEEFDAFVEEGLEAESGAKARRRMVGAARSHSRRRD